MKIEDILTLRVRLEDCLSKTPGDIIEYERRCTNLWEISQRSPLRYENVEEHDNRYVSLTCSTKNLSSGGTKFFHPNDEIVFLKDGGVYSSVHSSKCQKYECIYIPKKLLMDI